MRTSKVAGILWNDEQSGGDYKGIREHNKDALGQDKETPEKDKGIRGRNKGIPEKAHLSWRMISKKGEGLNSLLSFFFAPKGQIRRCLLPARWCSDRCKKTHPLKSWGRKKVLELVILVGLFREPHKSLLTPLQHEREGKPLKDLLCYKSDTLSHNLLTVRGAARPVS